MGSLLSRRFDTLIVMPSLTSRQDELSKCITQINARSELPFELLVVLDRDDESVVDSGEYVPRHPMWEQGTVIYRPTRGGLLGAYNSGFAWFAAGHWDRLIMMEDGITVTPGWDWVLRRTLENHPEFGWVACGQLEHPVPFTPLCSMMTRQCALAVRGLDPWFAPCQFDDADLLLRVQLAGFMPHGVPHRVSHPEGRTSVAPADRQKDLELMHRNRQKFAARWSIPDSTLPRVPIHTDCGACEPPPRPEAA